MDTIVIVAGIVVLALVAAPVFLMRGQYRKKKAQPGRQSDGSGDGGAMSVTGGGGSDGKGKGQDSDSGSDGGGGDGGD